MRILNPTIGVEVIEYSCIPEDQRIVLDDLMISGDRLITSIMDITDIRHGKDKCEILVIDVLQWSTLSRAAGHSDEISCGIANVYLKDLYYPSDHLPKHVHHHYPCVRYLDLAVIAIERVGDGSLVFNNLVFCENGNVLSSFDLKTKRYSVKVRPF